jgi:hypothetical protein
MYIKRIVSEEINEMNELVEHSRAGADRSRK